MSRRLTRPDHRAASRAGLAVLPALALAVVVAACSTAQAQGPQASSYYQPGTRAAAPAVSGSTLTGQTLSLAADRGSVVVLNFWGSWCAPCRQEAPALAALATNFARQRVSFVGVDVMDNVASAAAFDQNFGIKYPSLNDPGEQIVLAFHSTLPPAAIPSTLVIDPTGHIAARIIGDISYNGLHALIRQVLGGRP